MNKQKHAHKLVYETARALAHELYDTLMQDQRYYDEWRRLNPGLSPKALEAKFVVKNTGRCLEAARATLALMLRGPSDSVLKEQIHEALCLDATLMRGRQASAPMLQHQSRN